MPPLLTNDILYFFAVVVVVENGPSMLPDLVSKSWP